MNNVSDSRRATVGKGGFLSPLLREPPDMFILRNIRTGGTVAQHLITAFDSRSRNRGLLRHAAMPAMSALILAPTSAIHTFFMKFPIDVVFVRKDGRVVKVRAGLKPWRVSGALGAFAVVELPAASLAASGTTEGDVLEVAR